MFFFVHPRFDYNPVILAEKLRTHDIRKIGTREPSRVLILSWLVINDGPLFLWASRES